MLHSEIPLAQTIVALCKSKGIKHIVISPGSRNAPLTIGFTSDPFFSTYSIVDERSAAFFAMGMAGQQKEPVAVVCTSGSALLNYYPGVSEAFYSDIPLVVISADRPSYRIDIGDGQTIRQDHIFDRHILYSANLKQDIRKDTHLLNRDQDTLPPVVELPDSDDSPQQETQRYNELEINRALNTAIVENGPVHINAPFEEPLYNKSEELLVAPEVIDPAPEAKADTTDLKTMVDTWNKAGKKIVMVGVLSPGSLEQELLNRLLEDDSVVLLTETTSNLHHERAFPFIDKLIAPLEKRDNSESLWRKLQPEVLLTFGGMVVSKKVKAFLRSYQPEHHWHVDPKKAYDTYFCLKEHVKTDINSFLEAFLPGVKSVPGEYFPFWETIRKDRTHWHQEYIRKIPFSDFKVYEQVLKQVPVGYNLQLSNSSTIRYAQLFRLDPSLKVFCNRGTSGIDGSTSTAVGAAWHDAHPTLMVTGDLSFFYDSNALWNNYLRKDFRLIVVNNGGGGIFRILPGDKESENFSKYFETTHELNARGLCETFGLHYASAASEEEVQNELPSFYEPGEAPKLLEIFTPGAVNDKVLMGYFKFLWEQGEKG